MKEYFVIYVTCPSKDEARKIGQAIVEKHLAACTNIVPVIESVFRWEGKLEFEEEALMIIKTKKTAIEALTAEVKRLHPYDVPEIIAIPIETGNEDYLQWIEDEVKAP